MKWKSLVLEVFGKVAIKRGKCGSERHCRVDPREEGHHFRELTYGASCLRVLAIVQRQADDKIGFAIETRQTTPDQGEQNLECRGPLGSCKSAKGIGSCARETYGELSRTAGAGPFAEASVDLEKRFRQVR